MKRAALLLLALAACSSQEANAEGPPSNDRTRDVMDIVCAHAERCNPARFASMWGSLEACGEGMTERQRARGKAAIIRCTMTEWHACMSQAGAMLACSSIGELTIDTSRAPLCEKC